MPSYNVSILGFELSFKTDAQAERVESARELVEQRYNNMLKAGGKALGKEKLLAYVALGLADDVLMSNQRLDDLESRVGALLTKID
jgi:cell division protein ZapA